MKCARCSVPRAVCRVQCVKVLENVSDFKGDAYPFQWEVKSRGFHCQVSFVHAEMG
jgi:hypothetical protein